MTAKAAFEPDQWKLIEEAPTSAAMFVILAQRGGTFRETLAMGKEYAEVRQQHGQSELLDELVSTRPKVDHSRFHSPEELRDHVVSQLAQAVAAAGAKADPQEVEDYKNFILHLSERVAGAHSRFGERSPTGAAPVGGNIRAQESAGQNRRVSFGGGAGHGPFAKGRGNVCRRSGTPEQVQV